MSRPPSPAIGHTPLETPPSQHRDAAEAGAMAPLFAEELAGLNAVKVTMLESFFALLNQDLPYHDFMREILLAVMKGVKSEAGSILEVDHSNRTLFFRATVGSSSDRVSRFVIPLGQGIVGYVAESRQPLVVDDVEENKVYLRSIGEAVGFEARNLVAVPLVVRGQIYGVLELLNRVGESTYVQADVELLSWAALQASKAIEIRLMLGWAFRAQAEAQPQGRKAKAA